MASTHYLSTPLKEEDVRRLRVGDEVYLSGIVYTLRDKAHRRILELFEKGEKPPFDLEGAAIFHAGPIAAKRGDKWGLVVVGPTISPRFNRYGPFVIRELGVRAIVGFGGMDEKTLEAMSSVGAVYLAYTGGAASACTKGFKGFRAVHWLEFGMPDAVWELIAENWGPLIVAMDSHGNSLYEELRRSWSQKLEELRKKLWGTG